VTDFSCSVSNAMTYCSGHVPGRVADRSTGFLNLSAGRANATGKSNGKSNFNGNSDHRTRVVMEPA
jgi:hypothetical protein